MNSYALSAQTGVILTDKNATSWVLLKVMAGWKTVSFKIMEWLDAITILKLVCMRFESHTIVKKSSLPVR